MMPITWLPGTQWIAVRSLRSSGSASSTFIELITTRMPLLARRGRAADRANRNSSLLFVKVLFLSGHRRERDQDAEILGGQKNAKELIYET
jgi:hypothetical protein